MSGRPRSTSTTSSRTVVATDPSSLFPTTPLNPQTASAVLSQHPTSSRHEEESTAERWKGRVQAMGIPGAGRGVNTRGADIVPESWKSQVSMKTVRGTKSASVSGDESDSDSDEDGDGLVMAGTALTPPRTSLESSGRARSLTFGGVPVPAAAAPPLQTHTAHLYPSPELASSSTRQTRLRSHSDASSLSLPLDPSLHLGGGTYSSPSFPLAISPSFPYIVTSTEFAQERPIGLAMCKAALLFCVSLLVLWGLLKTLLPPIAEEDWKNVKLPKSLDELKALNAVLQIYKQENYWRVLGCYVTVYLFLQAFSIPGSMYMTILGGAMYGVVIALPLACTCVATGALLCYLISSQLGPALLLNSEKWANRVERWKKRIEKHNDNLISYLIVLRIAPVPPHFIVNLISPHLGISIWKFWISTFLGIMGVSFIHTQIGTTLDQMTSTSDFHIVSWQNGVGLGGIIVAVLIPVALRRAWRKDLDQVASEEAEDPAAALLLPSHSHSHPRSSVDFPELPMSNKTRGGTSSRLEFLDDEDEEEERGWASGGGSGGGAKGKERASLPPWNGVQDGNLGKASKVLGVSVENQNWR